MPRAVCCALRASLANTSPDARMSSCCNVLPSGPSWLSPLGFRGRSRSARLSSAQLDLACRIRKRSFMVLVLIVHSIIGQSGTAASRLHDGVRVIRNACAPFCLPLFLKEYAAQTLGRADETDTAISEQPHQAIWRQKSTGFAGSRDLRWRVHHFVGAVRLRQDHAAAHDG